MIKYLARETQIALLLIKEITVPAAYADFIDVFSKKSPKVLSKYIGINEHAIKLEEDKQPPYKPIYSLGPVELKILKTYIKTNLANRFIQLLRSLAGTWIFFIRKPDSSLRLYVNYRSLNNLTIKNWYPLLLIGEFLD